MNVLILGGGGREHALAWAIAKSPDCGRLIAAPGNAGMAQVAECVARTALTRTESRGAHQREDHPGMEAAWQLNQVIGLRDGRLDITTAPVMQEAA